MIADDDVVTVTAADATRRAVAFFEHRGVPTDAATVQAEHLVEAELRGHASHGLRRLRVLGDRLDAGLIDATAEPDLEWVAAATLRVDGRRGIGPVVAYRAVDALCERVPETGVAVASLHRTHHLGMLAPYVERMAARGVASIVWSSTEGLVHAWGGAGALVGTNPIAIGVPADGGDLVLDMSTGAVSAGKILDHRDRGMAIPAGWAVDADGVPTTDAAAAAAGAISPFGGAKGYALGIAFGALVGALTATALGPDVHGTLDTDSETTKGDVIVAFDTARVAGGETSAALGAYFDAVRASGVDGRVAIPGDRSRAARAANRDAGMVIAADVWTLLAPYDGAGTEEGR